MLLLDFQRYYIWLKVYYTGTFGQWPPQWYWYYCYCITAQHQTILLLTLGREQWSSGTLEHWNTAQKSLWYGPWEKSRRNLQIVVGKLGSYTHSLLSVLSNREDNVFRHIEWSLHYWPFIVECVLIKGPLRILVRKFWSYVFTITIGSWSEHTSLRVGKVRGGGGGGWFMPPEAKIFHARH